MGSPIQFLRSFPTQQQRELAAALRLVRRRVDQNLTAVAAPVNATTTIATLTCPANELDVGSVMHLQVASAVSTVAGAAYDITPVIAINGTTIWTGPVAIGTTSNDDKVLSVDLRIVWQTPEVIVANGLIAVSSDAAAPTTGAGSAATATTIAAAIYHTLSSRVMLRDQILTVALTVPNTVGAAASKKIANLWVE